MDNEERIKSLEDEVKKSKEDIAKLTEANNKFTDDFQNLEAVVKQMLDRFPGGLVVKIGKN